MKRILKKSWPTYHGNNIQSQFRNCCLLPNLFLKRGGWVIKIKIIFDILNFDSHDKKFLAVLITYKIRILPVDSFFKDLGEWDMINLGSGVGAVAIDMLSHVSKLLFWDRNFVSPSLWADSNRRPVNCGSSRSEEVLRLNNLIFENGNTSPILYHFNFIGPPLVSSDDVISSYWPAK